MDDYKSYLAAAILSEERVVTYRLLSRALKINVNLAKEMLYDFHRVQNGKKPGTAYATYLVSGTKRRDGQTGTTGDVKKDGDDDYMQSSPFMASSMPQPEENSADVAVLSISLTGEEKLPNLRSQYESISSIHIYSLGPRPLKDLQILSDITREVQETTINDDALLTNPTYGSITNKNVKRRVGRPRLPVVPASVPAVKPTAVKAKAGSSQEAAKPSIKAEPKPQTSNAAKDFFGKSSGAGSSTTTSKAEPTAAPEKKAPATLKKEASSIFKSFAKAKPKLKREGTDSSASAAVSAVEDEPMRGMSSDEEDDDAPAPPPVVKPASTEIVDKNRKSRKEREAALKKMMDEEEDEDEDAPPVPTPQASEEDEEQKSEEPEPQKEKEKEIEKEVPPVVSGGRRRGRRRVMKKKTIKDEEGYLVTKEEAVWESFSEDEPVAPKSKTSTTTTAKSKKGPAKPGQGSIMSFFGKK